VTERRTTSVEPLLETLTRREHEILGLLAEGLTAAEIAGKLTLATSSVKWYVQQVYGKLGVNNKRQALTRAGELGLLGTSRDQPDAAPRETAEPAPRHNLPLEVTRFFGRETEIAQLQASLLVNRLVTLVGSGGVGKSRLSLRAAEALVDGYRDGVWLVELAPLTNPAVVPQQVAATLGVQEERGHPILETLTRHLRGRHLLLLLDNCEHLLAACAQFADRILRTCPRVSVLASSREPLGVPGESVFSVPSLAFPAEGHGLSQEQLGDFPAVRLFVDRARLVRPDYQVDNRNAVALVSICQRLDGIPLALELAAARLRLLDTATLSQRLDDAFAVLTGGSRMALPRQQTLRATLDWSYHLLNDDERLLLQRLAVFVGGCTLAAAEAVCSGSGLETSRVLDRLAALVDKSMVSADRKAGQETRYSLLETVRQYAREKLNDSGDSHRMHSRHLDFYRSFAETHYPKLQTSARPGWLPRLVIEEANFRQALRWSFGGQSQPEAGIRLLVGIGTFAWSSAEEGFDWNKRAVAVCESLADFPTVLKAKLLEVAASYASRDDPPTALAWATKAVEASRQLGEVGRETLMWNLMRLSDILTGSFEENEQGLGPHEEAEAILTSLGPDYYKREEGQRVSAYFAVRRAELANRLGRYADAKVHAYESIRLYEASGSPWAWVAHVRLGEACAHLGEYQVARDCFLRLLTVEDAYHLHVLLWLARVDAYSGELARGLNYCRELIIEADSEHGRNMIATGFGTMAIISAKLGQPVRTARLAGASAVMYARQQRPPWEDSSLDTILPTWRDGPEAEVIQQAYDAGQAMSSDEAVAYALGDQLV
jgi:predicted ATPase/DNA-binding CsgD family transcriptional regulator